MSTRRTRRKTSAAAASGTPPSGSRRTLRSRSRQTGPAKSSREDLNPAATVKAPRVVGPPKAGKRSTTKKNPQAETATAAAAAEAAKAGLAPSPEEAAKLQSLIASTGRASITPDPQEEAAGAAKAGPASSMEEAEQMELKRRGKLPAAPPASSFPRRDSTEGVWQEQTPGVERKPPVPSGVGEFKQLVRVKDRAAEEAAQDAVARWMETFTPTPDAAGVLSMRFLENQGQAIVDGTIFIPPPLSVEGLAGEALRREGSGSLKVQQAILELVGQRRQQLVESVAAKLLTLERCAASGYVFKVSGIAGNIKEWLTKLLIGGTLPDGLMTYLADFIQEGGLYDILINPAGWLMSELGSLVTQNAINTYIAIWLTNQLIGAEMFAQMTENEELKDAINSTSKELLKRIQNQSFFDQLDEIIAHVYGLFQESAASLVAAVAVGFNAPEIMIQQITTAGERLIVKMSEMPQIMLAQAAQDALGKTELAKERRLLELKTAQTYSDAEKAAREALRPPVQPAGLTDFGRALLSQLGNATGQLIRSALVLTGMREPQPTDMITKINNNIADMLIGPYLGYIQKMGYGIGQPASEPEPVPPRVRLTKRQSEKIIDEIEREEREGTDAAAMIVGLIDRRVAEINPAAAGEPCPRRSSLSDLAYSPEAPAAAAAAPMVLSDDEEETQPLYPSDESFQSAFEGSEDEGEPPAGTGGARKRKRHSTRSSTSSKSSKSGTRKHGKAKSKRVKKSGAKTRHMRLPPGAGRRTRKLKHSNRGRK